METFVTNYGTITLYQNEVYIGNSFKNGYYWDIETLQLLKKYIPSDRDILEIGGHCGTSSIIYASYLNEGKKLYVYEPQKKMYDLLVKNIHQNHLQNKILPFHSGVFCYEGNGTMNDTDLDGGGGNVEKRYNEENNLQCNFGGISLGNKGESIQLTTIDSMNLQNIGYIHCDAQGAESFIFSKGLETLRRCRPVILYENNMECGKYLYDTVCRSYPQYAEESKFDIRKFCMEELKYSQCINGFNGSIDNLLIP